MLVKKKNPEWFPSENKELKVGETVDITDPKALIVSGDVVAVGPTGEEVSAYELYGVITRDERSEFEEYLKLKSQQALKASLEKEKKELEVEAAKLEKAKTEETATEKATSGAAKTATEAKSDAKKK